MTQLPTPLMPQLREQTQPLHQQLENHPFSQALLNNRLPLARYQTLLNALLRIHQQIEHHCTHHPHPAVQAIWQTDLTKSHLLSQDIAYLNTHYPTPLPPPPEILTEFIASFTPTESNPWSLLGTLYVFEGATLGARVLLPHLQTTYGLQQQGVLYYHAYGEDTLTHWQTFKTQMNTTIQSPPEQQAVITGAKQTFQYYEKLLTALWE